MNGLSKILLILEKNLKYLLFVIRLNKVFNLARVSKVLADILNISLIITTLIFKKKKTILLIKNTVTTMKKVLFERTALNSC